MYMEAKEKQSTTIGESVYYTLRKNIIDLNIKPGELISIKDLSIQLSVSRSPVRDALIKLEKEGLITTMPQKGTMVSKIDFKRVSEERFLRECLEEKVTALFVKYHTASDINRLKINLDQQVEYLQQGDYRRSLDYDNEFHAIFFEVAKKELCWNTIQSMSGHYRRVRLLTLNDKEIADDIIRQHKMMIEYSANKDIEKLIGVVKQHLGKIDQEEVELMRKYSELFAVEHTIVEEAKDFLKKDFLQLLR